MTDLCLYETHLHTSPVSRCARATVRETVDFYKSVGYAGIFITNHFIDGNVGLDGDHTYREKLDFYFSDYRAAKEYGKSIGLNVFLGVEMSYKGTDFLVYNLDEEWYYAHPEIVAERKSLSLPMMMERGALVIQAHPFREADYIDHIRLFPRCVQGVEIYNACRDDFTNQMAQIYCQNYKLIPFAGSDNHIAGALQHFGGMASETPIENESDFVARVLNRQMKPFKRAQKHFSFL